MQQQAPLNNSTPLATERRQRVLMLVGLPHFNYDDPHSAVAAFMRFLGDAIEQAGHEVLWSHPRGAQKPKVAAKAGQGRGAALRARLRRAWPYAYHSLQNFRYFQQQESIYTYCHELKPDCVVEFLVYGSNIGVRLKQQAGAGLHVIYDAPLNTQFFEMHGTYSAYKNRIETREMDSVSKANSLMTYSRPVRDYLDQRCTLPGRTKVLPALLWKPFVDRKIADNQFHIGFIGSFLRWHKVEHLVQAFASIADEFPQAHLDLIGYGQEWDRVKAMVDSQSCRARIYMPGFVDEEELQAVKARMTIGVMPGSNWYGSPLKLFEYAQCGIPMIAPSTPSVVDLFAETGAARMIAADNPIESLTAHLRDLLAKPSSREALSQAGKNLMQHTYSATLYRQAFLDHLALAARKTPLALKQG